VCAKVLDNVEVARCIVGSREVCDGIEKYSCQRQFGKGERVRLIDGAGSFRRIDSAFTQVDCL